MLIVPSLNKNLEIYPFDTSSKKQKYIACVNNRQFEISEKLYKLIKLIDGKKNIKYIAHQYSKIIGKTLSPVELNKIIDKQLSQNGFLDNENTNTYERKKSILLFKYPMFSSKIVSSTTNLSQYFFDKYIFSFNLVIIIISSFIFLNNTDIGQLIILISPQEMIIIYLLFVFSILFHEFGHASASKYYGKEPGEIGFGIYLYFPVFYSDVSHVWRIKRKQRFFVNIGGIYFQLILLPIFYLLLYNTNYIVINYLILFSILTNLNPFFRFDGYWIVSDISGVPNLRERAKKILIETIKDLFYKKKINKQDYSTSRKLNYFLLLYAIISNLFFLYFVIYIILSLSEHLFFYIEYIEKFPSEFLTCINLQNCSSIWESLKQLFFPIMMTLVLIMLIKNLIIRTKNRMKEHSNSARPK